MKKTGTVVFWLFVAVIAFSALFIVYSKSKNRTQLNVKQIDERVEASDFTLRDLDGNEVKLSDYRGKIVFLNFWTTWCQYCVEEMPELDKAHEELLKGSKAVMLTVNIQESDETVRKFMTDKKYSLPVLMDYEGRVADIYNVSGIPITYIINRDGTIYNYIGQTNSKTILGLANQIK